jgi:hypothetical protein
VVKRKRREARATETSKGGAKPPLPRNRYGVGLDGETRLPDRGKKRPRSTRDRGFKQRSGLGGHSHVVLGGFVFEAAQALLT